MNVWLVMWKSGLVVKFVLFALLFLSVISWAIIIKKRRTLKIARLNNDAFLEIYEQTEGMGEISNLTANLGFSPYHLMFKQGTNELMKMKQHDGAQVTVNHFTRFGFGMLERALKKGVNESTLTLEQYLPVLASIGSVSPFIGLFGTVWGIIDAFTGLSGGGASLDAVAPGIAEALVATAVGLFTAIPAVWFYNYYSNQIAILNTQMETFGEEFINVVERTFVRE